MGLGVANSRRAFADGSRSGPRAQRVPAPRASCGSPRCPPRPAGARNVFQDPHLVRAERSGHPDLLLHVIGVAGYETVQRITDRQEQSGKVELGVGGLGPPRGRRGTSLRRTRLLCDSPDARFEYTFEPSPGGASRTVRGAFCPGRHEASRRDTVGRSQFAAPTRSTGWAIQWMEMILFVGKRRRDKTPGRSGRRLGKPPASYILRRMRRLVALSCCALYLAFSFVAGTAHVHRSADHHDEMRGLHLDHAHNGPRTDHGPASHHDHPRREPSASRVAGLHVAHHDGDAFQLTVTAHRLSAPGLRVMPATVVTPATVAAPSFVSLRRGESSHPLRAPPGRVSVPARAPPA